MQDLKLLRKVKGFTQADMADKLGITPAYYAHIENGRRRVNLDLAHKISLIFNLSIEDIFFPQKLSETYSQQKQKTKSTA